MRAKWKVCSHPSCATLVSRENPCPEHGRPLTASWSKDRDHRAHARNRRQVMASPRGAQCERCGAKPNAPYPLVAHHTKPGNTPDCIMVVCERCHTAIDNSARFSRPRN